MGDVAIRVEHLSKRYRLGERVKYKALRDTLTEAFYAPVRAAASVLNGHRTPAAEASSDNYIWALKDVSFEIKQGEVVGIIGRNGAGKSTLLKILSRITKPSEGYARMYGRMGALLEVGTGFHPELTGRENAYLNGAILGMTKWEIDRKFDEIVAFAEVEKFIDTPVKYYSSGMYVRLAFAVAAHLEPEILLVDEVLAVGDAAFQKKCLGKMSEVAREGRTVLFVSHNMGAVSALCQKAILLEHGSVDRIGETLDVAEAYLAKQTSANGEDENWFTVNNEVLNRQQKKEFKITKIELFNPKEPSIGARTDDPLLIRITYNSSHRFLSPAFVVSLKDLYGHELVRLSTMPISGYQITSLYPEGYIELLIESLPLVGGRYYIDIGFVRERVEWIAKFENAVEFDIQAQDIYGSGLLMDRSRGLMVVRHRWDHKAYGHLG